MDHGFRTALPFWMSLGLVPLAVLAAGLGGWWWVLMPGYAWYLVTGLDLVLGLNEDNPDTETPLEQLFWYRAMDEPWPSCCPNTCPFPSTCFGSMSG